MSVAVNSGPHADASAAVAPGARRRHPRHLTISAAAMAGFALLTIAGGIAWRKQRIEQQAVDDAIAAGRAATARAAEAMEGALRAIPGRITAIRDELEQGTLVPEQVNARLVRALGSNDVVGGYGVAFDRDIVPGSPLFAPYLERSPTRGDAPLDVNVHPETEASLAVPAT